MESTILSDKVKGELAAQASTFEERVRRSLSTETTEETTDRLERWRNLFADENTITFEERLALEDTTPLSCPQYLNVEWPEQCTLPKWTEELGDLLKGVFKIGLDSIPDLDPNNEIPFSDVFIPFVVTATKELKAKDSMDIIRISMIESLQRSLLQQLSEIMARSLLIEFKLYLARKEGYPSEGTDGYEAFVNYLLNERGIVEFFIQYPVASRILSTIIPFWKDKIIEVDSRLSKDWKDLNKEFSGENRDLGSVETIISLSGDPHMNGRNPLLICFESDDKVVYKPRAVDAEVAFYNILLNSANRNTEFSTKTPSILSKDGYGWCEFIPSEPCENAQCVKRYFQRAGVLLGVAYALRLNDAVFENLIASNEYPVLVDAETVGHPGVEWLNKSTNEVSHEIVEEINGTVLETGLLPFGEDFFQVSGLGTDKAVIPYAGVMEWENINTDLMTMSYSDVGTKVSNNLPSIDGVSHSVRNYVDELLEGFRQTYDGFLNMGNSSQSAVLSQLKGNLVRIVYRNTTTYQRILNKLADPKTLQSGIEVTIVLDELIPAMDTSREGWYAIHKGERKCLIQQDIPRVTIKTDETMMRLHEEPISSHQSTSPLELVDARLRSLNTYDCEYQVKIVKSLFDDGA